MIASSKNSTRVYMDQVAKRGTPETGDPRVYTKAQQKKHYEGSCKQCLTPDGNAIAEQH